MMKKMVLVCVLLGLAACGGKDNSANQAQSVQPTPGEKVLETRQKAGAAAHGVQDKLNQEAQKIDEQTK